MKQDAETHAEEDKKKKELVDTQNQASSLIYSTEKLLEDNKEKVSDENKEKVKEPLEALKKESTSDNTEAIKEALDTLQKVVHEISEELYKAGAEKEAESANPQDEAQAEAEESKKDDAKVVDAEYTETEGK